MEVIILAGGLGTRLRSVINEVPKCMAPVAEKPFLWYLLKYLSNYNISKVILSVGYLRDFIIDWIDKTRNEYPFNIEFAIEETPLGTGGAIKKALYKTSINDILVLNGDTFFNIDLNDLYQKHLEFNSYITLALKPMHNFDRYGNVKLDTGNSRIIKFEEKKYCKCGLINGGVYVVKKDELFNIDLPEKFSFETNVLEPFCHSTHLYGIVDGGYFIDIGIPEDYEKANNEFRKFYNIFR